MKSILMKLSAGAVLSAAFLFVASLFGSARAAAPITSPAPFVAPVDVAQRVTVCAHCGGQIGEPQAVYVAPAIGGQPGGYRQAPARRIQEDCAPPAYYGTGYAYSPGVGFYSTAYPMSLYPASTDYGWPGERSQRGRWPNGRVIHNHR